MWEIDVLHVGRISNKDLRAGIERYASMIGGGWKVTLTPVPASRRKDPVAVRSEEGAALLRRARRESTIIALDASGKTMDSHAFGKLLGTWKDSGRRVTFLVGGAFGLDEAALSRADRRLSLSRMTFPHEMATLMLMEQLYRAHAAYSGRHMQSSTSRRGHG